MKIIKTYESYNNLKDLDLGRFSDAIHKRFLIPNSDGTYDYDNDLGLNDLGINSLLELPIKIKNVFGGFSCSSNNLISLEGSPEFVKTIFKCSDNKLISLQYLPLNTRSFHVWCWDNNLLSYKHEENQEELLSSNNLLSIQYRNNPFSVTDEVIETVKLMTHEQQMSELDFFGKYDKEAYKMLLEILSDLGVDVKNRKEVFDYIKEKPNLKALGLG